MSLKFKYIAFIGLLHLILIGLCYYLLEENKWYFIGSELLVILSLYLSYLMYKAFIRPIDLMQSGTDAIRDGDFSVQYNKTGSKEIDRLIEVYNQMIEQLRTERTSMSEQSYFVQKLLEVTPLGIIIMDFDGNISNINPSACKILNVPNTIIGKNLIDNNSQLIEAINLLEIGESSMIELNGMDKYKCQIAEVIHQGFKRKFILIDDLSVELLASEKDAYGRVIRMMAHEVNNSMGAINSILDSVVEFGFSDGKNDELKNSLLLAKERNLGLSEFMANYASILRLPKPNFVRLNLTEILKKSAQLQMPIAREKGITISIDRLITPISCKADRHLLEQAFLNILKNAIESVEEKMMRVQLDQKDQDFEGEIKVSIDPNSKEVCFSDNGVGINEEDKPNLFRPFYSTKPTGQGVGLMLIRDILHAHNASFSLETNPKTHQTNFTIEF